MGLGILWEIYQQHRINDAAATAEAAHSLAAVGSGTANLVLPGLEELRQRVEQLERWDKAVWSLLKERLAFTDDDLIRRLDEQKPAVARTDAHCAACGAKLVPDLDHCQICGSRG